VQSGCIIPRVTTMPRRAPGWTLPEPATSDTREQLLAAAERLFAVRGLAGVSVRMIAAEAGVNWSLVGYYFRGKDRLLAEVYRRHCTTLNRDRLRLLTEARRTGLRLESVIEAFVRPALAEIQGGDARNHYSRLRGMLAAEDAPLFTQLVADNFDQSSRMFVAALRKCLPGVPADEVLWRFHFMLGTIYYSASSPQRIKAFSRGRCDPGDLEATVRHLVPFLAAGFRSTPVARPSLARRSAADGNRAKAGMARRSTPEIKGAKAGRGAPRRPGRNDDVRS
jgi:AcrR family transcriptional regulator